MSADKKRVKKANPTDPARVAAILDALAKTYPGVVCALHHRNAWELTVTTILSAQCTDVRVNLVTPALFKAFPTPKAMAAASLPELEELIRTTGFYRNKAKSIKGAARVVVEEFSGKVPQTMEEILRLPGVARKTGNVVLGSWYGIAVIHDALGEKAPALAALQGAFDERAVEFGLNDHNFAPFRTVASEPAYQAVIRKVGR